MLLLSRKRMPLTLAWIASVCSLSPKYEKAKAEMEKAAAAA